ncbi:MAG TPA: efflux RND transporter periplasmic adaptor subunit [Candidatus Angelobacter sp.]
MTLSEQLQRFRSRKAFLVLSGAGVLLLAGGGLAFRRSAAPGVPTAEVRRGEFVDYVQVRGSIKALKSIQLIAPSVEGDLQIVKLPPTGTMVKKDEVVVQFDTSNLQRTLEQKQSDLKTATAEIERVRADARLSHEQRATDLQQASYNVERAKLDTSKNEILSDIEGAQTRLKLDDAEQKLKELQQKQVSGETSAGADIAGKKGKAEKARFDVHRTERQVASLSLRAPADGLVTIMPNFRAQNWMSGGSPPNFKPGDRAWGGAIVAELPDLSTVRISTRVDESDRGRIAAGQKAIVRIDAVPDKEFQAVVAEISPLAKVDYSSWPFTKNFDIVLEIQDADSRIRPGMSAGGRIVVNKVEDGVLVSAAAIFVRNGQSVAYVMHGSSFEERTVQVGRRGKDELLISSGLKPGEKVALQDPTQEKPKR